MKEIGGRMRIQLQIEEMSGYLAARFIRAGAAEDAWGRCELIAENCKRTKDDKLLIDFRGLQGDICVVDKFYLGERSRIFASLNLKVATVAVREHIDPQKFGELVARNRGVNIRVF